VEIADADALAVDEGVELRLADCIKVGEYKPKAKISHGSKDTTSNYDIEYIHTELTYITKRSVSFNVFGRSNVYNGKEIPGIYCEEKEGSLAGGDRVTIHVLTDGGEKE
jgi:hypothetical protein